MCKVFNKMEKSTFFFARHIVEDGGRWNLNHRHQHFSFGR